MVLITSYIQAPVVAKEKLPHEALFCFHLTSKTQGLEQ